MAHACTCEVHTGTPWCTGLATNGNQILTFKCLTAIETSPFILDAGASFPKASKAAQGELLRANAIAIHSFDLVLNSTSQWEMRNKSSIICVVNGHFSPVEV